MLNEAVQRLRLTFQVGGPMRYLSVLDMGRLWERLLRRAGLPLAYTQGFNPHPRLGFAAPLPVGYSSEMELLDVYFGAPVALETAKESIARQCPTGLKLMDVMETDLQAPALQAVMRSATYDVQVWSDASPVEVQVALERVIASESWPFTRVRAGKVANFDLRALILAASYEGAGEAHRLYMHLVCSPSGAGRPEDVLVACALPMSHWTVCRTALFWRCGEEE